MLKCVLLTLKLLTILSVDFVKKNICCRRAKLGQIQGGLQRAIQDSTKGGVAIIFYFLRVKNRTF